MSEPSPRRRRVRVAGPTGPPRRFNELDVRARRVAVIRTVTTIALTWVALVIFYYLLPAFGRNMWRELWRLILVVTAVAVVLWWQTRRVMRAAMPELQAIQALGIVMPLFLLGFSTIYLSLSHGSVASFSEPLDHTAALYYTITVFATVGFGDITAVSNPARVVVMVQMLLDLVILGFVVKVIFGAAKTGLDRERSEP